MKYVDLRGIEIEIKNTRNHLKENEKLCVRVDVDTHSYYEGVFKDMTAQERMVKVVTNKGVKFVAIQHIVAISYWVEEEV